MSTSNTARRVRVEYFALFRESAGCHDEVVDTMATDAAGLYDELRERHDFALEPTRVKVAVNDVFANWDTPLADGDRVVFIPPVAGG
jgi:molybdopterin converting factor subunit 1